MHRTLDLVEQIGNVVDDQARPSSPKVPDQDHKRFACLRLGRLRETATKCLVDHIAEGAAGAARERLQLRRDVVIEGQSRTHIMMLLTKHHDVKIPLYIRHSL